MMKNQNESYFADSERASSSLLKTEIKSVAENEVLEGILRNTSSMLAILNEHRQILALNDTLLKMLGIEEPEKVLGLRPGEAIECIHANDMPGGCGTSKFCASCGAAIAIVSALEGDRPQERTCVAEIQRNGKIADIYLRVKATPITFQGHRFILLFLQDISKLQKRALLERVFFHDISNIAMALVSGAEMLNVYKLGHPAEEIAEDVLSAARELYREIALQKRLLSDEPIEVGVNMQEVAIDEMTDEIARIFRNHPSAEGKKLEIAKPDECPLIYSDKALCVRVLNNMVLNALEACPHQQKVRVVVEVAGKDILFKVWNPTPIPPEVVPRIFQRGFSTKADEGRGLGTYSMKLFAEHYLDGEITFTTSPDSGTTFTLKLPC
ncbi:MAG: ATP-binding protein [bacterium]